MVRELTRAEELWELLGPTSKLFPDPAEVIFRGQESSEWGLVPSVFREPYRSLGMRTMRGRDTGDAQVFHELRLLQVFAESCDQVGIRIPGDSIVFREGPLSLAQGKLFKAPKDWPSKEVLEVMAMAQHHGVPTRLLDWSRYPYSAAYFAARGALANWRGRGRLAVWAMNIELLGLFREQVKIVKPPGSVTSHLAAQGGLFTLQTQPAERGQQLVVTKGLDHALAEVHPMPLLKLTLPVTEAPKLYTMCNAIGVNAASQFPTGDGAARAVLENVHLWAVEASLGDGDVAPSRLAHAFVFACDVERVAAFYAGAFGMRRENSSDAGFTIMRAATGADVAIHSMPPSTAAEGSITDPPRWRDGTAYKICFETHDLAAQRAAILAHGGQAKEPWSWEGTDFCECTDPEGNVVQIFQRAH